MDESMAEFETALAGAVGAPGEHLPAERLVDYHHDRLSSEEAEAVEEHLAACGECGDFLLELVRFESGDEEEMPTGGEDLARGSRLARVAFPD